VRIARDVRALIVARRRCAGRSAPNVAAYQLEPEPPPRDEPPEKPDEREELDELYEERELDDPNDDVVDGRVRAAVWRMRELEWPQCEQLSVTRTCPP
jgi:hypothetical protein